MSKNTFKKCPNCGVIWDNRKDFLADPDIMINGYQANFDNLKQGLFLFDHKTCQTTMAIKAEQFRDLYDGPVFRKRMTGDDSCPGYCLRPQELSRCPNECDCAWAREIVDIIVNWEKIPA